MPLQVAMFGLHSTSSWRCSLLRMQGLAAVRPFKSMSTFHRPRLELRGHSATGSIPGQRQAISRRPLSLLANIRPYPTREVTPLRARPSCLVPRSISGTRWATPSMNCRLYTTAGHNHKQKNRSGLMYVLSVGVLVLGLSYAAVPLYRLFCSAMGAGGKAEVTSLKFQPENMVPRRDTRRVRITFNADVSQALNWSFRPQQKEVYVYPGETALVFYTACNNSDKDLIGISTYNVTPSKAGVYFNKIQCFCFEEQMLRAGEEVDMPIFFFLDPEMYDQPQMRDVDTITLSYTFFNAKPC